MVFLHALSRGAALFARHLTIQSSNFLISLCKGPHQLWKTNVTSSNPFGSSPHFLKPTLFPSAYCVSVENQPHKKIKLSENAKKDSTYVFREWGCTETDISKIFQRCPSLRTYNIKILQPKLEILSRLGIKSADLVKMIHCRPRFLNCKINVWLNERLEYLESLFGSRDALIKAIVRNPSLLTYDFHNKIKPVIAIYESLGLSRPDVIAVLARPTLIPRTTLDDEKMDYICRTGVPKESKMYKHVVSLFAISRIETIREKVMNFERYELSEDKICGLIGRSPLVLTLSIDKVQRHMAFILGTMKLSADVVLRYPFLLYLNLETGLKARFTVACRIEDMGLSPRVKGPALLRALRMSEKRFVSVFISCHVASVAEELMSAYKNAKCVKRLAVSSKKKSNKGFPF